MCTAVHFNNFFGRNLDLDISYNEQVILTPQNYPLTFKTLEKLPTHLAIIGIGTSSDEYPLYYDGMNEAGLAMAGLNFPGNAHYFPACHGADNIAPFELIPYILGRCESVCDAKKLLSRINIADISFSQKFPNSPLHWMISDKQSSIVAEQTKEGLKIHDNPVGILTNSPTFDYHLTNLANYINITSQEPQNRFSQKLNLSPYSRGMGGIGIPGDLSSASRFVRASFTLLNSSECNLSQFFHILGSVAQQKGAVHVGNSYEYTLYSSCCDMEHLVYYYTTYENPAISAVYLNSENLDSSNLIIYPIGKDLYINHVNKRT
jgi:choloylglycine hydrolase